MLAHETIRVPVDRVGAIVGRNGRVRKRVEALTNSKIEVTSDGVVTITASENMENPILIWKARDIIHAMGRGFSPRNAMTLIDDDARLLVRSLRDEVGTSPTQLKRVAGRIIGENGRTRRVIETITEAKVCVYGHTVAVIGTDPGIEYASRAIGMLIEGAPHATVYRYLEKMRRDLNRQRAELWE